MYKYFFLPFVLFFLLLGSCSEYNKVLKSEDYDAKWKMANELYDKGLSPKVDETGQPKKKKNGEIKMNTNSLLHSISLYEQIYQRMPKTGEGELAYYRIGKAYYHSKDFVMAGYYLGAFAQRYPYSAKTEEAMFLSAVCSVQNSPEYSLDQNETNLAIKNLQTFVDAYPNSILVDSCNHVMDRLRLKLEKKDFEAVKGYAKTENYRAAVTSAEAYLEKFPLSKFNEEVSFILVENSFLLSKNSIETKKIERFEKTKETCLKFANDFPNSEHINQVKKILEAAEKEIKI